MQLCAFLYFGCCFHLGVAYCVTVGWVFWGELMSFVGGDFPVTIAAGIAVASAFPIGALLAIFLPYSPSQRALFVAFGAGIFFAAVMLLVQDALQMGNIFDLIFGFSLGAASFGLAQHFISHRVNLNDDEEKRQKRIHRSQSKIIVIGTILDSVPETLFLGIIVALAKPGVEGAIIALFLGNLATTLEGAKLMHLHGMRTKVVLRDWLLDFVIVAVAAPIGFILAKVAAEQIVAIVLSFAAGTLVVFIAGELIARAYRESTGHSADLSISIGFLLGVVLLFVI